MTATTLSLAAGITRSPDPEALATIARPGIAAALWERHLPLSFAAWLCAQPSHTLPTLRATGTPMDLLGALEAAAACLPASPWREFLLGDILDTAARFSRIVSTRRLRLRLEVINTDACRRFHVDRVRARLLCTYRGAGTELAHLPLAGSEPTPTERLAPGNVAILRGSLWSSREATGLLHRSPPFIRGDVTRLLLVLDPDDNCACC